MNQEANFDMNTGEPLKKPSQKYPMTAKDYVFVILSFVISIAAVALTFWGGFKIGFTVSYVAIFALLTMILFDKKLKPFGTLCGVLALALSGVFAFSFNGLVNFFIVVEMFVLSAIYFSSLRNWTENRTDIGLFTHIFVSTFGTAFGGIGRTFASIFSGEKKGKKNVGRALIGVAISLPLVAVVIILLSNADEAFGEMVRNFFRDFGKTAGQITLGVLLAPFLISFGLSMKNTTRTAQDGKEGKGLASVFVVSFMALLCVAYVLYLVAQLAYFVNGFMGILPGSTTYAQYARKGFFELCVIAGINFAVMFGVLLVAEKKNKKPSIPVVIECEFIGLFTLFIVATAIAKIVMYMQNYGLTTSRVFATSFMVFIAVVIAATMIRFLVNSLPVLRIAAVTAAVTLLVLGYGNVNALVAKQNMDLYKHGVSEKLDVSYYRELGYSGLPFLYDLYKNDETYSSRAAYILCEEISRSGNFDYETGDWIESSREPGDWNMEYERGLTVLKEFAKEGYDQYYWDKYQYYYDDSPDQEYVYD